MRWLHKYINLTSVWIGFKKYYDLYFCMPHHHEYIEPSVLDDVTDEIAEKRIEWLARNHHQKCIKAMSKNE